MTPQSIVTAIKRFFLFILSSAFLFLLDPVSVMHEIPANESTMSQYMIIIVMLFSDLCHCTGLVGQSVTHPNRQVIDPELSCSTVR